MSESYYSRIKKVYIYGGEGSGKSSLIVRLTTGEYSNEHIPTTEIYSKTLKIKKNNVKLYEVPMCEFDANEVKEEEGTLNVVLIDPFSENNIRLDLFSSAALDRTIILMTKIDLLRSPLSPEIKKKYLRCKSGSHGIISTRSCYNLPHFHDFLGKKFRDHLISDYGELFERFLKTKLKVI
jgi:hypothetical protein